MLQRPHNPSMPASRFHGDRYPRTLQEAFGPHTDLRIETEAPPGPTIFGFAVTICVALVLGFVSWALQQ